MGYEGSDPWGKCDLQHRLAGMAWVREGIAGGT